MLLIKVVFKQLFKSGIILFLFFLFIYFGLKIITIHNDHQIVPNLIGTHINDLDKVMTDASICGLGQAASNPINCVLKFFQNDVS